MITKPSDLLDQVPTVSELLDKPPLRALAEHWNRSLVVAGVRSFLGELRTDLQRRTAEANFPSVRELAERAARHIVEMQQSSVRPTINATGRFFDTACAGPPLADEAIERMAALAHGFVGTGSQNGEAARGRAGDAAAVICRLSGAEAATLIHSYSGAIWMSLAALAAGKKLVVAAGELGDVETICSLAMLAESAGAAVRVAGSVNRSSAADYEAAISKKTAAIVKQLPDSYRVDGDTQSAELDELVALARDREIALVQAIGSAPLVAELPASCASLPSASASIALGVQIVVLRGDGFVGGPPCGIIVGSREVVRRIEAHPLFAAWQLDALRTAALGATLELYGERMNSIPLVQLLTTSVENLRHRAEHLAPQLAAAETVDSAEPFATQASFGLASCPGHTIPSYAVGLTPANGDLNNLERCLLAAPVPVVATRQHDRLIIDLRTVLPRQDQQLVDSIVGRRTSKSPASVGSPGETRTEMSGLS
jgi:L-seryl-tRNA(Ser) seleniumtransferase